MCLSNAHLELFDYFFVSYRCLEDLDLSYTLSRIGRLAVIAEAGFSHFPSPSGRVTMFQFGRYEVRNRLHFVRKHNLSLSRCYLGLAIRLAMSFGNGIVEMNKGERERTLGNLHEFAPGTGRSTSNNEQDVSYRQNPSHQPPAYRAPENLPPKES